MTKAVYRREHLNGGLQFEGWSMIITVRHDGGTVMGSQKRSWSPRCKFTP